MRRIFTDLIRLNLSNPFHPCTILQSTSRNSFAQPGWPALPSCIAFVVFIFEYATRSAATFESVLVRGMIFMLNMSILGLLLIALFCLAQYLWQLFSLFV